MDYNDVKTGADFQRYLKENEMVTSCIAEKYLEYVRRCQETIKNIQNMRDKERKFYESRGVNFEKELKSWELHRLAYIRVALSQCEFKSNIHNLNGWINCTNDYKRLMKKHNSCELPIEFKPLTNEKIEQLETTANNLERF